MRDRAVRRSLRETKIQKRESILKSGGFKEGTLYEKHREKVKEKGSGYMAKHGTLLHFAKGTNPNSQKTRDRDSYNGTTNWGPRDTKSIDSMNEQENEYENEITL